MFGIFAYLSLANVSSETEKAETPENAKTIQKPANVKGFVDSQIRKSKLAYRKKDYNLALEEANKALEVDPRNEEARQLVSLVQEKLHESAPKREEAISVPVYKQKAFVQSQIDIAKRAYRKADYEAAYSALKKGLQVDPRNKEIKQLMGSILEKQPNIEQVLAPEMEETAVKPKPSEAPSQPRTEALEAEAPREEIP